MALSGLSECITYLEHFYTEKTLISSQGTNLDIESEIKQNLQLVLNFKVFSFLICIPSLIQTNIIEVNASSHYNPKISVVHSHFIARIPLISLVYVTG